MGTSPARLLLFAMLAAAIDAGPLGAESVKVTVRLVVSDRTGPSGVRAVGDATLGVGETGTLGVFVKDFGGSYGCCAVEDGWEGDVGWRVTARPVEMGIDAAKVELTWVRLERVRGRMQVVHGDPRLVTLAPGARHTLDVVASPSPASSIANAAVEIEVDGIEDPAFAGVHIAPRIWLVEGHVLGANRLGLTGSQGETVSFSFPEQRLAIAEGDGSPSFGTHVTGTIRSRLRPDGTFDVFLLARRHVNCGQGWTAGGGGRKVLSVHEDEKVRLEFRSAVGICTLAIEGAAIVEGRLVVGGRTFGAVRPGVTVQNGRLRVDTAGYFARDPVTSVILSVARR